MFVKVPTRRARGLRGMVGQARPRYPYGLGGLRGFVGQKRPVFPFGLGCACGVKTLGDDVDLSDSGGYNYDSGSGAVIDAGGPTYMPGGGPAITPPDENQFGIPGGGAPGSLSPAQLAKIATTPAGQLVPGVSPATLLAAASLPGAPAVVLQAAAMYKAANPVSSTLSGTILGVPTYLAIGGVAVFLFAFVSKSRK